MAAYGQPDAYFLRKTRAWWELMLGALQRREAAQERAALQRTLLGAQAAVLAEATAQGSDEARQQWDILWERIYTPAEDTSTAADERQARADFAEHDLRARGVIRQIKAS